MTLQNSVNATLSISHSHSLFLCTVCGSLKILTLFVLFLIFPFPVDSVVVDFAVAVAVVRPTLYDIELCASSVANVTMLLFDN